MKKFLLSLGLCLGITLTSAQDCTPILRDAQQAYNRGQLRTALRKLQDTEFCDIDTVLVKQRQALQRKIFNGIEQQRRDAVAAKEEAIKARLAAQQEKAKADSALDVANRVLGKFYFHEDKFGLTLKNVAAEYQQPRYRYGFINRLGEEVIPFEFEEASPFSLADGFARVKREGKAYLLDTLGKTYLLATSLAELTPETQALDLHESRPDSLPEHIGNYPKLEILLAYGGSTPGKLVHLPAGIGNLKRLRVLNLRFNALTRLPPQIGHLSQLNYLNLSSNQLRGLPEAFGRLNALNALDLSFNPLKLVPATVLALNQLQSLNLSSIGLSQLPAQIGQMSQLLLFNLSDNQLVLLPPQVGELHHLQQLDLSLNRLIQLPDAFSGLKQLQSLDLTFNLLTQLPPTFEQLSKLHTLDLTLNQFTRIPEALCKLPALRIAYPLGKEFWVSGNPLIEISDCYLEKFSEAALGNFVSECLHDSLYQVAYQSMAHLLRRFPKAERVAELDLLAKLDELEAAGISHESFSKMRALLKPKE